MINARKHTITAAILLVIFSLNTVVGFACSAGLDMGFNSKHHCITKSSNHKGDKHHPDQKKNSDREDCCNNKVLKFEQLDKSIPAKHSITHPVFLVAFATIFSSGSMDCPSGATKNIKQFVRSYHPPIPDIRIAIQSFQI